MAGRAEESGPPLSNQVEVAAQWREPAAPGASGYVLEIYLANMTTNSLTFTTLAVVESAKPGAAQSVALDGKDQTNVMWRQFYPAAEVLPGATVAGLLCFSQAPRAALTVAVGTADGRVLRVQAPPWRIPENDITALTFSRDYRRLFAQYHSAKGRRPVKAWVNGLETACRTLAGPAPAGPHLLALGSPPDTRTGTALHVRLLFQDGTRRDAIARALSGIVLDAYLAPKPADRVVLGLDAHPAVTVMTTNWGGDAACFDARHGGVGLAAAGLVAERARRYAEQPETLSALHYCTARYTALWNVYGAVADAAYVNPYNLSFGKTLPRWLDAEIGHMTLAVRSARPRPWLWMPDAFQRRARFMEPEELRALAWVAFAKGCKGLNYFAYGRVTTNQAGFESCVPLKEAVVDLNKTIARHQERLAPLAAVSEETLAGPRGVALYTAWAGDMGLLAVARNLDYTTDAEANMEAGRLIPRFKPVPKDNFRVTLALPEWLRFGGARDFISDEPLAASNGIGKVEVLLPRLDAFNTIWIENTPNAPTEAVSAPTGAAVAARAPVSEASSASNRWILLLGGLAVLVIVAACVWRMRRK